eukprot:TRINITY_DN73578_c0_g1_i1.p1 TRINITY_DN73578_c0_g1~~TRINITY_DN73578_c0_g1_i1.p1  ORF type:complete len:608 (+),score=99.11 TRINITY_DN73578_c0_g1_i1:39-1862(+)
MQSTKSELEIQQVRVSAWIHQSKLRLQLICLPMAAGYTSHTDAVPLAQQLQSLLDEDFQFQLKDNPEFATQAGFHEHDSQLQDLSPKAWEARLSHNAHVLGRLGAMDTTSLPGSLKLRAQLLRAALEDESRAIELGCHLTPINSIGIGGVHWNFLELTEWMLFQSDEDIKCFLDRLNAFPAQVQSYQDLLTYGAGTRRMSASRSMIRRVTEHLQELVASNVPQLRDCFGKGADPAWVDRVDKAIESSFKEPLRGLLRFFEDFYYERCRAEPACTALPQGQQVYAQCLRFHTSTTKTARDIHDMGVSEVARIEERFQRDVLDALKFKGSFTEFAGRIKKDQQYFYTSADELLSGYKLLVERIYKKLPEFFSHVPKMPLDVVPKQGGPAAYYFAGTPDGKRPGRFYVNTSRLSERAKYEMTALALHEGVPGHHLQGAIALENEDIPNFLRYIEDRRYEYCPARRPLYTAYLEGWALYCEALGEEMGMYDTPQDLFGRLSIEMMRAVRLVVDTGIHEFGWSVERAAEYMEQKTGMAASECSEECHRYAAWPGQACGYKVGQLAIEDMRRRAEAKLGAKFDVRAFHRVILDAGPMPLDILAQRVEEWSAIA